MKRFLERWQPLKSEQKRIESELRILLELIPDQRTEQSLAREQVLMESLMENLRKRQELEEEIDQSDSRSTVSDGNSASPEVKFKKKRKFKLKKLLGVHM